VLWNKISARSSHTRTSGTSDGTPRYCSASPELLVATVLSKFSMSLMLPPSHRRVRRSSQRLPRVAAASGLAATAAAAGWPVCR
jgi:hypothetical protein